MSDNHIEFIEKPRYHAVIHFGEEKQTEPLFSKGAAFKKIARLANEQSITVVDFSKMRDAIFGEDALPWEEDKPKMPIMVIEVSSSSPFRLPFGDLFDSEDFPFGFMGLGSQFGNPLIDSRNPFSVLGNLSTILKAIVTSEIKEPIFVPCEECKGDDRHGKILAKGYITGDLSSRENAMDALAEGLKQKLLTEEEGKKVHEQIDAHWSDKEPAKKEPGAE